MKTLIRALTLVVAGLAVSLPALAQDIWVNVAPPAPVVETRPAPPGARGWTWMPGYYRWNGYRYVWVHGHWAHPPRTGAVWVPGHWVQGPRGRWHWRAGHWRYM